jgi:hypothetical protein
METVFLGSMYYLFTNSDVVVASMYQQLPHVVAQYHNFLMVNLGSNGSMPLLMFVVHFAEQLHNHYRNFQYGDKYQVLYWANLL